MLSRTSIWFFLMLAYCAAGCDRAYVKPDVLVEVHGEVYMDGNPVSDARVLFVPENTDLGDHYALSYGFTNAKGEFELKLADDRPGAFAGKHRVFISKGKFDRDNSRFSSNAADAAFVNLATAENVTLRLPELIGNDPEQIPCYYNSQSELTCELIPGRGIQRPVFELSSIDPMLK